MIFHENRLPADDSHEISCLIFLFLKKRQDLKLLSASNCRWRFKGYLIVSQTSTLFLLAVLITFANSLEPDQDPNYLTLW